MSKREYPEFPLVGVGGVVIANDKALLVRRGTDPGRGEWTIPGGLVEVGETLDAAVTREIDEETGLTVRVVDLIEALERIFFEPDAEPPARSAGSSFTASADSPENGSNPQQNSAMRQSAASLVESGSSQGASIQADTDCYGVPLRPKYHYVILDYLCEVTAGEPIVGDGITDFAWVRQDEMNGYRLTDAAARVINKAFVMARARPRT